jgi:hypothetical protein
MDTELDEAQILSQENGLSGTEERRSRKALPMTEIELRLMAAAATIGERSTPKSG